MSDLFSGENLIEIDVYYTIETNKAGYTNVVVLDSDKAAKMLADDTQKSKVKKLNTKWKSQTWQASNEMLTKATQYNHITDKNDINWMRWRDSKLKECLVEWSAKNDKGEPLPCVSHNIDKLNANVALSLLQKYDEATSVDEESQLKKS